jgi:two-component system response regulator EvgA
MKHKALIVDDHPFVRASVKMLLELEGFEVVGEADNGRDAWELVRNLRPHIVVLDIAIPFLDGMEIIKRIQSLNADQKQQPPIKVLVLTSQSPQYYAARCISAGASGFISKSDDLVDFSKALRALMAGYAYFPSIAINSVRRSDVESDEAARIASLSRRELTVLQQLSQGLSNKQIAEALLLSNKTVSTYKVRLIEKLNVASVVDLADLARRHNLA